MTPSVKEFLVPVLFLASVCCAQAEEGWKNESQVGVVTTAGNTNTTTLSAAEIASYEFNSNVLKITGGYLYQESNETLSAKAWNLGLRYERILSERFSLFAAETIQGDRFKNLKQSYSTDVGAKYTIIKDETLTWFAEAGYRYTRENLVQASRVLHFARVYNEVEKKWNASFSTKYWIEMLPNFTNSVDWQANTELSLSAVLTSLFSVKTAYLLRFDHQPNAAGLKSADKTFTTSLVAKF